MQQFITVRVYTMAQCSHSDLLSYKNLPQSDCRDSELLQQEATAAAEEEETLTQTTEHRADRNLTKHTILINITLLYFILFIQIYPTIINFPLHFQDT